MHVYAVIRTPSGNKLIQLGEEFGSASAKEVSQCLQDKHGYTDALIFWLGIHDKQKREMEVNAIVGDWGTKNIPPGFHTLKPSTERTFPIEGMTPKVEPL